MVSHALNAYRGVKPPLAATVGDARLAKCSPALFDHFVGLQQLWNEFNDRTGDYVPMPDVHVIESQAHARQMIEHIMTLDRAAVNALLDAEPEYTQLLHGTRQAFGFQEKSDLDQLLLLLVLHDKTCDLAFAVPGPALAAPLDPRELGVGDLRRLMPDGLVARFERILAEAMEHLRDLGAKPLPGGKAGAHEMLRRVERYADHAKWLADVPVRTGPALAQSWLDAVASTAPSHDTPEHADPIRYYRMRAMSSWQPFETQAKPENPLAALLRQLPAFRVEQAGETEWVMDALRRMGLKSIGAANSMLARCADDFDAMAAFDGFSYEYVFGPDAGTGCPFRERCKERGAACERSITAGMTPTCRVTTDLGRYANIPAARLTFVPR